MKMSKLKRIGFQVRLEVAERLRSLAEHKGCSMTAVLEALVQQAPMKRGPLPKKAAG